LMGGGEHFDGMTPMVKCLGDIPATKFVSADVVRRVEIGNDKDAHKKGGAGKD
jgi:hypothetical protein